MSPDVRPGARVLVRWAGLPHTSPCHLHLQRDLPLFQQVGVVDRIDERFGEHRVIVRFPTLAVPPFGTVWVDSFTASELVAIGETG